MGVAGIGDDLRGLQGQQFNTPAEGYHAGGLAPPPPVPVAEQERTLLPEGVNQQGPGVGEQRQQINEGFYNQPGVGEGIQQDQAGYFGQNQTNAEGFVKNIYGQMPDAGVGQGAVGDILAQGMGNVGGANPTAQAYQQFQANRPDIAQDPGLAAYYQNAGRQALEGINQNAAARGAYGSSAALAQGQEALTNLAAERANREADYNLRRLAEQRGWEGLGGQLAGQQAQSQLGWAQGLGGLGLGAEQMDLQRQMGAAGLAGNLQGMIEGRLGQGFGQGLAAQQAAMGRHGQAFNEAVVGQGLRDNRIQTMLQNQFQRESMYAPMLNNWANNLMGTDIDLLNAALGGDLAAAQEVQRQKDQREQQIREDASTVIDIYSAGAGGKGGGGGGGAAAGGGG